MSCAEDFKDDFGPIRIATEQDIEEARRQRQLRYNKTKHDDLTHASSNERHVPNLDSEKGNNSVKSLENESLKRHLYVSGQEELIKYLEEEKLKKRRKLYLSGQEELVKYLEEEKLKKTSEKEERSPGAKKKASSKNTPLMLIPVEETERQKILAQLETKKRKTKQNKLLETDSENKGEEETKSDPQGSILSISSELDFEDASENFCEDFQNRGFETTTGQSIAREVPQRSGEKEDEEQHIIDDAEETILLKTIERSENDAAHYSKPEEGDKERNPVEDEQKKEQSSCFEENENHTLGGLTYGSRDVDTMRRLILGQLNGNKPLQIEKTSLFPAYKEIYSIFSHTIHDCESHTVLLTGASGSGKTEIVKQALAKLQELSGSNFITILLSGSLQPTEQHAIREIARQLDMKLKNFGGHTDEDTYEQRAISDTFQNILSTLSKLDDSVDLSTKKGLLIRVVFLIDEIEKFTENPRQTLLYNLFELSQESKVPICILGITLKVTIRDYFEKRVKSRFSQRMVQTKRADDMETFWQDAKGFLTVPETSLDCFENKDYPRQWNEKMEQLFQERLGLKSIFYTTYFTTKSYRLIYNQCTFPVSKISISSPFPKSTDFEMYLKNDLRGIEAKILSLAPLELLVVVAAARWIARSDTPQVNFKLMYREYSEMMETNNLEATTLSSKTSYIDNMSLMGIKVERKLHSPNVLQSCWRFVYRSGILFDVISSNHEVNAANNLNLYRESMIEDSKMLQLDISLEELAKLVPGDSFVRRFTRL